ncbi:MAG: hypothetical protein KAI66_07210, partial [Lentisphaeria bacterium]|nr:hypothetical protein [Lentisphaeria bacterium]
DIPEDLSDLTLKLISSDPQDRPSSMDAVAESLGKMERKAVEASHKKPSGIVVVGGREERKRPGGKLSGKGKVAADRPLGSTVRKEKVGTTRGTASTPAPRGNEHFVNRLLIAAFVALIILLVLYLNRQQKPSGTSGGAIAPSVAERSDKGTPVRDDGAARTRPQTAVPGAGDTAGTNDGASDVPGTPLSITAGTGTASLVASNPLRAKRPRPAGLDFTGSKSELAAYLAGLPAAERTLDERRIRAIEHSRDYLTKLMRYLPFREGAKTQVKLRDGSVVNGAVPYCNEKTIGVRIRGGGSRRIRKVPWNDLAFEQYIEFFDYYMNVRVKQGGKESEAASDCLRLALLCEWYGRDREAIRYARQTVAYDAKYKGTVHRLVPQAGK